ncbi:MAG: hypothetical protein EOP04_03970 [Proteobacteria bacterium]|nr:MAG: hypothetical protein EOP04_03970 [Pseudomonadota bacterium]
MKRRPSIILATFLTSMMSLSSHLFAADDASLQVKAKVQKVLMNPEGKADGLLLDDGTQVKFPPHMSQELSALVKASDSVSIKGFRENAKVFKAESITNTATNKSVADKGPVGLDGKPVAGGPGEPGPGGPRGPKGPENHKGLSEISAQGKIQTQLFGKRGEVNGAILADGSIVRFSPRVLEDSKVKLDVGQGLKVSGFGTQTSSGKSLEATTISNN